MGTLRKKLVGQCQTDVVNLGCKEIKWGKIGKPREKLYSRRVVNLNALFLLALELTEDEVKVIDCFVLTHG